MARKPAKLEPSLGASNFAALVEAVKLVHEQSATAAGRAVNVSLTMRNWLIGWHIYEYEQRGADRAEYGERLLDRLAEALRNKGVSRTDVRELRRYRRFYMVYPQIRETVTPEFKSLLPPGKTSTQKIGETASPGLGMPGKTLLSRLSFSMSKGDNPPLGLFLCTQKDHALVEYALAGIDNKLFVSKYLLELPSKEDLQRFPEEKRREMGTIEYNMELGNSGQV